MAVLSFLTYLRGIYKLNLNNSSRVHYAIIQSIYDCFIMARDDIDVARLEMCLNTATGYWLDYWGEFFSVYRKSGEEDSHYSKRIIDSVIQPKSTIPSIKDNIVDYLNSTYSKEYTREDIRVLEPWTEVAKYSHKGALSKDARFCSGDYYTHAVLDINIPEEVTNDLVDLVNAVKAAGVKVIWSILNSYDIVSGFNSAEDAWAAYSRHIQTRTNRNQFGGLVLSNSSPSPRLSGSRQVWWMTTSLYQWYAKILDTETDDSVIITKKDLLGLIDYYTDSDTGQMVKITDDMIKTLELMDAFLSLSYKGRLSASDGVVFKYTASHELYGKLVESLEDFKEQNPDYYNSVQPPILVGDRAMWLVQRNKNWIWNTPTMTHEDFYKLWEPYGDYEEHTINSIIEFEDAYYKGYITFGDKYQPPIVSSNGPFYWAPRNVQGWLWDSPVYCNEDLEEVFRRQFNQVHGKVDNSDPTLEDLEDLEDFNYEKYSVSKDTQPAIEIIPKDATS